MDKKLFRLWDSTGPYGLIDASMMGWDDPGVGEQALNALAVGQQCEDEDGDTWERIA